MPLAAVILAAGQGTRMAGDLPKVLHEIRGRPMVSYVVDTVKGINPDKIVVVIGYQADRVRKVLQDEDVEFALQEEQLGTGHAVMQCKTALSGFDGSVLVLNGDVPFLQTETIRRFVDYHTQRGASATVLSAVMDDATGYGRIVRSQDGSLLKIVEHKDAVGAELEIKEINSGLFCFDGGALFTALDQTDRENAQNEYYITDVIELLNDRGQIVGAYCVDEPKEVAGVNTESELDVMRKYFEDAR